MESSLHFSSRRSKLSAASVSPHFSRRLEICVFNAARHNRRKGKKRVIDKRKENDGAIRRVGGSGAVFLFP